MGFHETRYLLVEPADDTRYGHPYHGIDRSNSAQVVTAMSASPAKEVLEEEARFWDDNDDWDFSLPTLEVATSFHERYRRCGVAFEILGVSVCQSEAEVKLAEQVEGYLGLDVSSLEPHSAIHPASIWKDFFEIAWSRSSCFRYGGWSKPISGLD